MPVHRERSKAHKVVVNLLATAISVAVVVVAMILFDAPTWAWVGIGYVTWMISVNLEAMKGRQS